MKNVKERINAVLLDIQTRNGYEAVELREEFGIVPHLGFSSLDVAELIALLEMELDVDPFAQGVSIMDVHTIGKLQEVYAAALQRNDVELDAAAFAQGVFTIDVHTVGKLKEVNAPVSKRTEVELA